MRRFIILILLVALPAFAGTISVAGTIHYLTIYALTVVHASNTEIVRAREDSAKPGTAIDGSNQTWTKGADGLWCTADNYDRRRVALKKVCAQHADVFAHIIMEGK